MSAQLGKCLVGGFCLDWVVCGSAIDGLRWPTLGPVTSEGNVIWITYDVMISLQAGTTRHLGRPDHEYCQET
jgi:hypothetical protein